MYSIIYNIYNIHTPIWMPVFFIGHSHPHICLWIHIFFWWLGSKTDAHMFSYTTRTHIIFSCVSSTYIYDDDAIATIYTYVCMFYRVENNRKFYFAISFSHGGAMPENCYFTRKVNIFACAHAHRYGAVYYDITYIDYTVRGWGWGCRTLSRFFKQKFLNFLFSKILNNFCCVLTQNI